MRRGDRQSGRCSCGLEARFAVPLGWPTISGGDGGPGLQLCYAHYKVWTVDRVLARLLPARLALAESDDLIAPQIPPGGVTMETLDEAYFMRHFRGGR